MIGKHGPVAEHGIPKSSRRLRGKMTYFSHPQTRSITIKTGISAGSASDISEIWIWKFCSPNNPVCFHHSSNPSAVLWYPQLADQFHLRQFRFGFHLQLHQLGHSSTFRYLHLSPVAILGKWWPHWDSFRGYSQLQPLFGEGINHTVRCSDSSRRSTQQPRSTTTSVLGDCITFSHCVQLPATSDPFLPQALRTNSSKSQPKKRLEHQWGNSPKKSWKYMFG